MLNKHYQTVIIGAGPSGLIAAIETASGCDDILIIEKMKQPSLKLRITGKGRCNITNDAELEDFLLRFGKNGRFLKFAFASFFNKDLICYFEKLGIQFKLERGGRYFPVNDSAPEVAGALLNKLKRLNIPVSVNTEVTGISKVPGGGFNISIDLNGQKQNITAQKVLLATGGKSYPRTGSDGSGYRLAASLGHKITPPKPSLVPIVTHGPDAPRLQGLSLKNVLVTLRCDNKKVEEQFGEMVFTEDGVSGPIILSLSKAVIPLIDKKNKVILSIDFKPALDHEKLDRRLQKEISENHKQNFKTLLKSLLPRKLITVFLDKLNIPDDKPLNQVSSDERKKLRLLLKNFEMPVLAYKSIDHAIITSGGINIKEINPQTMESKLVKDLYFAGEIIDIDADTGGYNLQAAFSTGWIAGRSLKNHW